MRKSTVAVHSYGPAIESLEGRELLSATSGAFKNVASGGDRKAIRESLAARAKGADAPLSDGQRATLDKWVAEKPVSDADLRALAAARAERLRDALAHDHGVDAARIVLGDVAVDRDKGRPGC